MDFSRAASTTATTPQRCATPESSPFADPAHRPNPFASPYGSRPPSTTASSTALRGPLHLPQRYFHSRRVQKGDVEKPWMKKKDPKEKWVTIIPLIGLVVGLGLAGFLVYDGLRSVVNHKYCPVLIEDFNSGQLNDRVWTKEVELGGYGNGQFEMTTNTDENVFIKDGKLYIRPTLQDATIIETNQAINLTEQGICTSDLPSNCYIESNVANGTIVNPVKSGRINTKKGAAIKYGRVEVRAKLPEGDWLWPAIWMMPVQNTYGPWPQSGEIDIMEGRGNNYTYAQGGNNIVSSTLHWGPNPANDAWWRTNVKRSALHTTFAKTYHTYGVEWSSKYLFTYIDTRLLQVLYTNFDEPLWKRGNFPLSDYNGTRFTDVWSSTGRDSTPFDQEFYLILNVAVGGTNGWFEDGKSGKPWVDHSTRAMSDFWNARNQWHPTWKNDGAMVVESVKMWQECD